MSDAFDKLARPVQKWIRRQGWQELRHIQARSIEVICDSKADLIIAAPTAGGKTEAAFLPLISAVLDEPAEIPGFALLYIGPLKALINDQTQRLEDICCDIDLPVFPWHGDVSQSVKKRATKSPHGILLITPESLEAMFIRRGLELTRLFGATRAVVIDELHSLLDSERGVQLHSLLTRLEVTTKHSIRRIGLSATLGNMDLAKSYLKPDQPADVQLITDEGRPELRLQLRGYLSGDMKDVTNENRPSAANEVAGHLFRHLRGTDNLVFAGSRHNVELYADQLRELCEKQRLPQEFYAHHANLSKEHRFFVEERLKEKTKPTTAVCTSTLELGIDIGEVVCVAQIGAPFSVASLRQRLGRSGRRQGKAAILRQYAIETQLQPNSSPIDRLRLGLVRSVAMIELLLEGWCEPPISRSLHLSTLVHQILSLIAQLGGVTPDRIYRILCHYGPFRQVSTEIFMEVLRSIGHHESNLIEQAKSGKLLLGSKGEKLVEHYSFYTVFQTPEEFRLVCNGHEIGTLPVINVMFSGMLIIFAGRRWLVEEVHDSEKIILVKPDDAGVPPVFGGDPGIIHDKVIERMFNILEDDTLPRYMDDLSREMLEEARRNYEQFGFRTNSMMNLSEKSSLIATRRGTVKTGTLALGLKSYGFSVEQYDGFLQVETSKIAFSAADALRELAAGKEIDFFAGAGNLQSEKYHCYLTPELLRQDAASSRLVPHLLTELAAEIIALADFAH